jgi:hypothetical protein
MGILGAMRGYGYNFKECPCGKKLPLLNTFVNVCKCGKEYRGDGSEIKIHKGSH